MKPYVATNRDSNWHSSSGSSMVEVLVVVAIATILTSLAVPQMLATRRWIRSTALPQEIAGELRFTRQQAMSQRQAFTFQYDDSTKKVTIFDHNNVANATAACNMTAIAVLSASGFPNTTCTTTVMTVPLAGSGGLPTSEVTYGIPSGISATTLGDTTTMTALSSSKVLVTFQSDGSIADSSGSPNRALFFYNNVVPNQTAAAVSVLGMSGRVKVWRYDTSASKYAE